MSGANLSGEALVQPSAEEEADEEMLIGYSPAVMGHLIYLSASQVMSHIPLLP